MREDEKPLGEDAAMVERVFALKLDREPLAEVLRPETHDRREAVLEDPPAAHAHAALGVGDRAHRRLASEVDDLSQVVALVLQSVRIDSTAAAGRPTWSWTSRGPQSICATSTSCAFPNLMVADLARRGSRARSSLPPMPRVIPRCHTRAALLPSEG